MFAVVLHNKLDMVNIHYQGLKWIEIITTYHWALYLAEICSINKRCAWTVHGFHPIWDSPTVILAKTSGKFFSSHCLHLAGSGMYSQYCAQSNIKWVEAFHSRPRTFEITCLLWIFVLTICTYLCRQWAHCGERDIFIVNTNKNIALTILYGTKKLDCTSTV